MVLDSLRACNTIVKNKWESPVDLADKCVSVCGKMGTIFVIMVTVEPIRNSQTLNCALFAGAQCVPYSTQPSWCRAAAATMSGYMQSLAIGVEAFLGVQARRVKQVHSLLG